MAAIVDPDVPGFFAPVHRALTDPILMGGAPRTVAIARNPTQSITRAAIEVEDLAAQLLMEMIADGRWLAKPISEN